MRLAVDAHNILTDRRGIGVYVRALLPRLGARAGTQLTLLLRTFAPARMRGAVRAALGGYADFALAARVPADADVVWHPWNGTFFTSDRPSVATIHDCTPFAYPSSNEARRRREQEPFLRSAASSRRIIADSHFTAEEITEYLGVPLERIDVALLAADESYTPGAPEHLHAAVGERPYVLFVGAGDPRKNLSTLVDAWRRAFPDRSVALVCVTNAEVPQAVVLENLSVEQLRDLYRGALCCAVPSYYEGFGLPALEAMCCGAPVIAARAASLPEVCGEAARYVDDPRDVAAWAARLHDIATNEAQRNAMRGQSLRQASRFSWDRTAERVYAALERVASGYEA
jgi:glycosyltransferase involved in cell wall biosynthesis